MEVNAIIYSSNEPKTIKYLLANEPDKIYTDPDGNIHLISVKTPTLRKGGKAVSVLVLNEEDVKEGGWITQVPSTEVFAYKMRKPELNPHDDLTDSQWDLINELRVLSYVDEDGNIVETNPRQPIGGLSY